MFLRTVTFLEGLRHGYTCAIGTYDVFGGSEAWLKVFHRYKVCFRRVCGLDIWALLIYTLLFQRVCGLEILYKYKLYWKIHWFRMVCGLEQRVLLAYAGFSAKALTPSKASGELWPGYSAKALRQSEASGELWPGHSVKALTQSEASVRI